MIDKLRPLHSVSGEGDARSTGRAVESGRGDGGRETGDGGAVNGVFEVQEDFPLAEVNETTAPR
jgi:hypothetical protein